MPDPWDDLDRLREHLWQRLARGAEVASDPFRLVTLATSGGDGPQARIVALRVADEAARTVEVHTDRRSSKLRDLAYDPRAAVLLWDAQTREQLRLTIHVTLRHADPVRWQSIPPLARENYGTDPAPGVPISDPRDLVRRAEIGRHTAIIGRVQTMDAVSLAQEPHRRALFKGDQATWVAP